MRAWLCALLVILAGPAAADPSVEVAPPTGAAPPPGASPHAAEAAAHADRPPAARTRLSPDQLAALRAHRRDRAAAPTRVVYGYYPYWVADLERIRWSALTHLAWFSIELDATGAITNRRGWPDAATVLAAHAAGVRVDLTFTLFSGSGVLALTRDPARRAAAIAAMIRELEAGDADGISVDFEGLIDGTREHFTTFIAELRAGLDAAGHADAEISIAGPEVNWPGADGIPEFDLPRLLDPRDLLLRDGLRLLLVGLEHRRSDRHPRRRRCVAGCDRLVDGAHARDLRLGGRRRQARPDHPRRAVLRSRVVDRLRRAGRRRRRPTSARSPTPRPRRRWPRGARGGGTPRPRRRSTPGRSAVSGIRSGTTTPRAWAPSST
jgi:hypothetical protein